MKNTRPLHSWLVSPLLVVLGGGAGLLPTYLRHVAPKEREVTITARKYAYTPSVVYVNRGDRVHIKLVAQDVTHGFYLEGYDVDAKMRPQDPSFWVRRPSQKEDFHEASEITFLANRTGKFHYRCSVTCGYMHPFMQGELIVRPNSLFPVSLGLLAGLAAALFVKFQSSEVTPGHQGA